MRTVLIHNQNAGDGEVPTAGQLMALIKEAGLKVQYHPVRTKGWHRSVDEKLDFVVAAGGDGTVAKVARRLVGSKIPLAVLPLGTANNISRTLGISQLGVTHLIRSWKKAAHVSFDAGVARGPWGKRYFIEGVGTGLLTHAIPHLEKSETLVQLPDKEAQVSYAQQIFRE